MTYHNNSNCNGVIIVIHIEGTVILANNTKEVAEEEAEVVLVIVLVLVLVAAASATVSSDQEVSSELRVLSIRMGIQDSQAAARWFTF